MGKKGIPLTIGWKREDGHSKEEGKSDGAVDSGNRVGPLADSFVSGGGNLFYSPFSRISNHRMFPVVRDSWKPAEGPKPGEERPVCLRLHGSGSHSGDGKYCRRGGRSSCGRAGSRILMWASAVLGMMTAYAEVYLGRKYRYKGYDMEGLSAVPMLTWKRGWG